MKNLILIIAIFCMVGCANKSEVSQVAQAETNEQFKTRMADQGTPVKEIEISQDLMDQAYALIEAQKKAGGAQQFDQANAQNYELIDQYRENPTSENMNNILAFMETTKIPLLTTAGLIYEPERIKQIIESSAQ